MTDAEPKDDFPRAPAVVGLILSALPMLVYPFVLMANLMSVVAEPDPTRTGLEEFGATSFIVLSTAYPVAWLGSLIGSVVLMMKHRAKIAAWTAFGPMFYLALVGAAFWVWTEA